MAGELILGLLFKIAPSLLTTAARTGINSLLKESPVTEAIEGTCITFPALEPLRQTLENFSYSNLF
jgi:hypothetical protein